MPTLEERVEALEQQLAAIESGKYEMSYSGQSLEATLDFVNERKLVLKRATASQTTVSGRTICQVLLNVKKSDFGGTVPFFEAELMYDNGGASTKIPTESISWTLRADDYYTITAVTTATIPNNATVFIYYAFAKQT